MKHYAFLLISIFISGCATPSIEPVKFNGPNGKTAYAMKCNGMGKNLQMCYQKAGEVCPNGYTIVDKTSGILGMLSGGDGFLIPQNSLAIECK